MTPPFRRILVANRSEIALRVIRAIRELGAEAVAVYSDADANALHVRAADHAVHLGAPEPAESYLAIDKIVGAARETGAEAVHPGYGFLSENADFARACEAAGLAFIGPTGEAMESLGDKRLAKETAAAAGVPCVPGFDAHGASPERLAEEARRIGFPLLVKAAAGGGGRGMRLVTSEEEFADGLDAGRREALQAFGDDTMLLEKYVKPARHVEVQILGDGKGNAVALGERECSVQRRHQKVLEESPSPVADEALRRELEGAAVALASAVRYRNAGTVEFLVDPERNFYFLEVNTRLQVEHPVTELVTGLDLVHLQIALAAGAELDELLPAAGRVLRGWALEARVCAEDPERGFIPATGRLAVCALPRGPGVRIDTGYAAGSEVPVHYDSLLAKVIVHAPNRAVCIQRMERALADAAWLGLPTNVDFLLRVIRHPAFLSGDLRTDFLEVFPELLEFEAPDVPREALLAAALAPAFQGRGAAASPAVGDGEHSPWRTADGFRVLGGGAR